MSKKTKGKKDEIVDESTMHFLSLYRKQPKKYFPLIETLNEKIKEENDLNELFVKEQLEPDIIIDIFKCLSIVKDINGKPGYKHLKSIRLWNADVGDIGFNEIRNYIVESKAINIKTIEMINCNLREESCIALSDFLHPKDSFDLQTLILDNNQIGNIGLKNLLTNLKYNTSISYLSLAYCSITYEGIEYIKELFDNVKNNLIYLSLEGNSVEAKGAQDLMNYITELSPLEELNLKNTLIIGDLEFYNSLTTMMNSNMNLGIYNFKMNHFTDDFIKAVIDVLSTQKIAKDLHIYEFHIPTNFSNDLYEKYFALMNGRKKPKKKGKKGGKSTKKK